MLINHLDSGKSLRLIVGLIVFGLSLALLSTNGLAHPPSNIEAEYLGEEGLLTIKATHRVGNPSSHYIEEISVFKNGNLEMEEEYSKQDASNGGTYEYRLSAKNGDSIKVEAACNRFGNITDTIEVKGVPVQKPVLFQASLTTEVQVKGVKEGTPGSASGLAVAMLDREENVLKYTITYKGLSDQPTMAHFHRGTKGEEGPPVRTIFGKPGIEGAPTTAPDGTGGFVSGEWRREGEQPLTGEMIEALLNGEIYVNVHTELNPAGEIRAQLMKVE
ncbi:CHRD domain-containing protein [Candidatus Bipolaricaulota bacterium]|nr:CHRD domain-containing protein [Candidatus Bipolaricaulota bacterium]